MKKTIYILGLGLLGVFSLASCNNNEGETKVIEYKDDKETAGIYTGNYYDSIDTTDGTKLKSELNTLINSNFKHISYSEATQALKQIDSYDGHYVECLYTGERMDPENSGSSAGQWNKEHIWAKTYGFNDQSFDAYSDIQMLRVTESKINGNRSDKYFDDVENGEKDNFGNKWDTEAFEVRDEAKGDVARIMLYMTVKYDSDTLDLELTNDKGLISSSAKQKGGTAYLGMLDTLLQWAANDPVDEREIDRNNAAYEVQNNRNPFIDHPEYAYYIYKDECDQLGLTYDKFYNENKYVSKCNEGVDYVNGLIDKIGTVTLDSEKAIEAATNAYNALGQETKSYVTKYQTLQEATYKLQVLKDLANRDTTKSATFDFTNLSSVTGSVAKNGININYECSLANAGKGIYSQTNKAITFKVSNMYKVSKAIFDIKCNKNNPTFEIVISDGNNTVKLEDNAKTSSDKYSVDVSTLDLTKDITITITNKTGNSVILSSLTFEI